MERKEFLSLLGMGSAATALVNCLGCSGRITLPPANEMPVLSAVSSVDFTLDLNDPKNSVLNTDGGYLYSNNLIVAKTLSGKYVAAARFCTHQTSVLIFDAPSGFYYCRAHGATFSESGSILYGPATVPIKAFTAERNGNSLRVYG